METIEYVYISNVCVFYIAKVQLSFTTMVGDDLLFVVGFVCSRKHQLQLNISCKDHSQMICIYIYWIQNMIHLQTSKN
jgi:hypothetical protein